MFSQHFIIAVMAVPLLVTVRFIALSLPWAKTGFFCDDDEIRHPMKTDTIKGHFMFFLFTIIMLILVPLTEYSLTKHLSRKNRRVTSNPERLLPAAIENIVYLWSVYVCGDLATSAVVNVGKRTMSRLRPNFLAVCQPDLSQLCKAGSHVFVEDYTCRGEYSMDEFFSFPSGHAAHSVFFGVFLIMYLQKRCKFIEPFKSLLQLCIVMFVFFICTSRVRDFKHRLSDVAGGAFVGGALGFFFVIYALKHFRHARYETSDADNGYASIDGFLPPEIIITTIDHTRKTNFSPTSEYGSVESA
uniref:AcidPPc domain-containing protein n=1 Tax=Panagrellus redivivus TaxID=6233 RepID=A0A7E4V6Z2_PANRE